jgi:hypothetical protein
MNLALDHYDFGLHRVNVCLETVPETTGQFHLNVEISIPFNKFSAENGYLVLRFFTKDVGHHDDMLN